MNKGDKKNKRYNDPDLMPFDEIAKRMGMSTGGVVRVYDRAMAKLRLRYSSPARREWLLGLLAPRPSAPGRVPARVSWFHPSDLNLRKFPVTPKRKTR